MSTKAKREIMGKGEDSSSAQVADYPDVSSLLEATLGKYKTALLIIQYRFGLLGGHGATLDEIPNILISAGHLKHIKKPRERCRQLEAIGLRKLRAPTSPFRSYCDLSLQALGDLGGVATIDELRSVMEAVCPSEPLDFVGISRLGIIVTGAWVYPGYNVLFESGKLDLDHMLVRYILEQTQIFFSKTLKPVTLEILLNHFLKDNSFPEDLLLFRRRNVLGEYLRFFLPSVTEDDQTICWPHAWHKRTNRLIVALKRLQKPGHYTRIVDEAMRLLPIDTDDDAKRVYRTLQRRKDIFVRTGRGEYGLRQMVESDSR